MHTQEISLVELSYQIGEVLIDLVLKSGWYSTIAQKKKKNHWA